MWATNSSRNPLFSELYFIAVYTRFSYFIIRMCNLGAEAGRSLFMRYEPENVHNMLFEIHSIVFKKINSVVTLIYPFLI